MSWRFLGVGAAAGHVNIPWQDVTQAYATTLFYVQAKCYLNIDMYHHDSPIHITLSWS